MPRRSGVADLWYDSTVSFRKIMDLMQFFDMILHVDKTLGVLLAE